MKTFKKNTRGQFTIIAALLISILTLSLVLSIHQTNLHRQQLRYEPVEELVLGITSDLDRCLTHALSIATQRYHDNKSLGTVYATNEGYNFISKWVRSILASYTHLGIKMAMSVPENETAGGPTDIGWSIDWAHPVGVSQVFTKFDLDIDAYGFKGWVGRSAKFVRLEVLPQSIEFDNQSTTLEFQILQGKLSDTLPIPNLTPESLNKTRIHITEDFWASDPELQVTALRYLGEGTYSVTFNQRINEHTLGVQLTVDTPEDNIVVSALHYRNVNVFINLQSQEINSPVPTNNGTIEFDGIEYLPGDTWIGNPGTYFVKYFPEPGYVFYNWTTTSNLTATNQFWKTYVVINGNGNITAFYKQENIPPQPRIVNVTLDSREWDNSTYHLGNITLGSITYTLRNSITVDTGNYSIEYKPENSGYVFLWWEWSGDVIPENYTSATTTLTIYGDGNVTAVYSLSSGPPPSFPGEWGTLYLALLPPDKSMLLPYSMLPGQYFNPRSSTLPIPPRPYWQYINVSSPAVPVDITLAKFVNMTLYIQLASGKAENITIELSFTYNGITYLLGNRTFYNLVGEGWYTHTIDTDEINKVDWPVPGQPIIPAGSVITLTAIVPPNSGTIHIIYGWDNYQSRIELF